MSNYKLDRHEIRLLLEDKKKKLTCIVHSHDFDIDAMRDLLNQIEALRLYQNSIIDQYTSDDIPF